MAVIECSRCGGKLEINENMSVGKCMFCDSLVTIPKSWEHKGSLYNRANYLRQSNQFDKAQEIFEDILKEDNTEAEAHWGLLMCRYGIEYVLDPDSNERIPTCHRTEKDSIFVDPSYKAAIQFADEQTREVYEEQAQRIDKIQQKILRIVEKEEPYDIFICYKQRDDASGEFTEDSFIGEDLYYELKRLGYKVFFAQQTLKPGTEYEPYIFAALFSAKVLIVVGTKAEYTNAVWVRNEWSRFLAMMKKNPDKEIIPVYKGMSPYDFPKELGRFHAMDTTRLGFLQELRSWIDKIVRKPQKTETVQNVQTKNGVNVAGLLKRAFLFIEDGDFASARTYLEKVLDQTPEDAQAYWGRVLVDTKCQNDAELALKSIDLTKNNNYLKALRFGSEQQVNGYDKIKKQCLDNIRRDNEERDRRTREANAKEQRRNDYHYDFKRLQHKYTACDPAEDALFTTYVTQKQVVEEAQAVVDKTKGAGSISWWTIILSIVCLILPGAALHYILTTPHLPSDSVVLIVFSVVMYIPLAIIAGIVVFFIVSMFIDEGCVAWPAAILGGLYGGGLIGQFLMDWVETWNKPYYLLLPLIGILLIVIQIIKGFVGASRRKEYARRLSDLYAQKDILSREWTTIKERGKEELKALNERNMEFSDELHTSAELFENVNEGGEE